MGGDESVVVILQDGAAEEIEIEFDAVDVVVRKEADGSELSRG